MTPPRLASYVPSAIVMLLGLIASVGILLLLRSAEHGRVSAEIERRSSAYSAALQERIDRSIEIVQGIRRLYNASQDVTRDEFHAFTAGQLDNHPEIQALEWIPRVGDAQRAAYEGTARNAGVPGFAFTERASDGSLRSAGQRAEYYPVYYVEPLSGNEAVIGYDLASSTRRWEALERARDTGSPVATGRVTLVQDNSNQSGFLVFVPVYRQGRPLSTVDQRRDSLLGFALGVFRVGDVVQAAIRGLPTADLDIYLQDFEVGQAGPLLYSRPGSHGPLGSTLPPRENGHTPVGMSSLAVINLPGRVWQLELVPTPQLIGSLSTSHPWNGLAMGLALTATAVGLLYLRTRATLRAEQLARNLSQANTALHRDALERDLIEKKLSEIGRHLELQVRSMPLGLITLNTDFRVTSWNPAAEAIFGFTSDEARGRPAAELIVPTGLQEQVGETWRRLLDGVGTAHSVDENATKDGRAITCQWANTPLITGDGRVTGILSMVQDITDRVRAEGQTAARGKRLEALQRLSHAMAGSVGLKTVARLALEEVRRTFASAESTVSIALLDEWGQQVTVVAALGPRASDWEGRAVPLTQLRPDGGSRALFENRRSYLQGDMSKLSQTIRAIPGFMEQRSFVAVPLVAENRVIGALFLALKDLALPLDEDVAFLETCAREIALGVRNAQLFSRTDAALRQRITEQEALTGVLTAATKTLDLESALQNALKRSVIALAVDAAGIGLVDESGTRLTVETAYEKKADSFRAMGVDLEIGALPSLKRVIETGQPLVIPDVATLPPGDERTLTEQWRVHSALVAPMLHAGRTLGTMHFAMSSTPKAFTRNDVLLAQAISNHLAAVVENVRLHERTEMERNHLSSILASMGEGLVVVDANRQILYFNQAAESILGLRSGDFVGKHVRVFQDALGQNVADIEKLHTEWAKALARLGELPKINFEIISGPGKRTIESTLFAVQDRGQRQGTGVLLRDVTREREVDRMKSEFVSIVSHELRTPMTMILGFTELIILRATNLSDNERAWVQEVHRESNRLASIVEDLLNVSRIEAGTLALEMGRVALRPLVANVLDRMQRVYPSHSFNFNVPDGLAEIRADAGKLEQILANLVDNAAKYSPQGGPVVVSARFEQHEGMVIVSVSDKGLGISSQEMPRLFTRFYRVHRPETAQIRGTGLGLSIVKSLVEMMGGRIWVESEEGTGSTFHFSMQVAGQGL